MASNLVIIRNINLGLKQHNKVTLRSGVLKIHSVKKKRRKKPASGQRSCQLHIISLIMLSSSDSAYLAKHGEVGKQD